MWSVPVPRTSGSFLLGLRTLLMGDNRTVHFDYQELPMNSVLCGSSIGSATVTCTAVGPNPEWLAAVGANGLLYLDADALEVRSASLQPLWRFAGPPPVGLVLDCSRNGAGVKLSNRPGVVYFSSAAVPAIYAVVVDSRGLDFNASWPLPQHDPRRTNSAETSLAPFSCP